MPKVLRNHLERKNHKWEIGWDFMSSLRCLGGLGVTWKVEQSLGVMFEVAGGMPIDALGVKCVDSGGS